MGCTLVNEMSKMDYGLKEMNEMDYGLRKLRWNVINEVDNVTREELRLSDYVIMWCKPITEQWAPTIRQMKHHFRFTINF